MNICYVKHREGERAFIFDCTDVQNHMGVELKPGDNVVVETMYGNRLGVVDSDAVEYYDDEKLTKFASRLLRDAGAYLPLKKVVSVLPADIKSLLTEEDKEVIAREWLGNKLGDLPF